MPRGELEVFFGIWRTTAADGQLSAAHRPFGPWGEAERAEPLQTFSAVAADSENPSAGPALLAADPHAHVEAAFALQHATPQVKHNQGGGHQRRKGDEYHRHPRDQRHQSPPMCFVVFSRLSGSRYVEASLGPTLGRLVLPNSSEFFFHTSRINLVRKLGHLGQHGDVIF
jgi:hypothetical protein